MNQDACNERPSGWAGDAATGAMTGDDGAVLLALSNTGIQSSQTALKHKMSWSRPNRTLPIISVSMTPETALTILLPW